MMVNRSIESRTGIAAGREAAWTSISGYKARFAAAALALLSIGLVAGCGASRPVKYYQLALPGGVAPTTAQPLPVTIVVNTPSAPALYRDNRLVYTNGELEVGTYEYSRWAGPPPELIRDVFVRQLRATGRYSGVYTPKGSAGGDFALRTRIYDFKEEDAAGAVSAKFVLDAELVNLKTGAPVWQHPYSYNEASAGKNIPDVVAAMNKTVQSAATDISSALDQYFVANPPK
jgi:ABC-type uncharacterized transport system auxiliary subunit